MKNLEARFDKEILNAKFTVLEIAGFAKEPMLAVKAGMAIGYKVACDDILQQKDSVDKQYKGRLIDSAKYNTDHIRRR